MIKKIVGVIVGLIVGGIVVMLIEMVSSLQHPLPEGLDMTDKLAFAEHVAGLPTSAFVIVLVAHIMGALVGGFICSVIVRQKWITGFAIIGTTFMIGGIINLAMIPHPTWFTAVDFMVYIPSALIGGFLGKSFWKTKGRKVETELSPSDS